MKLSLPSIALGAAIAAVPTVLIRIAVVGPVHVAGVPTASDLVTINTEGVAVASGQSTAPIFAVPSNRWLVVTGMSTYGAYGGSLYEARGSVRELKLSLPQTLLANGGNGPIVFNGGSPFPIAFAPGSVVELGTGANGNIMSMTFSGYLE